MEGYLPITSLFAAAHIMVGFLLWRFLSAGLSDLILRIGDWYAEESWRTCRQCQSSWLHLSQAEQLESAVQAFTILSFAVGSHRMKVRQVCHHWPSQIPCPPSVTGCSGR
jgi:hypothetical protein